MSSSGVVRELQLRNIGHGARQNLFFGSENKNERDVRGQRERDEENKFAARPAFVRRSGYQRAVDSGGRLVHGLAGASDRAGSVASSRLVMPMPSSRASKAMMRELFVADGFVGVDDERERFTRAFLAAAVEVRISTATSVTILIFKIKAAPARPRPSATVGWSTPGRSSAAGGWSCSRNARRGHQRAEHQKNHQQQKKRRRTAPRQTGCAGFWRCAEISLAVAVFGDDVDDFGRRAFHVEDDFVHAADEIVVAGVRGNGHGDAGRRADQRLPDAAAKAVADVRIKPFCLQSA